MTTDPKPSRPAHLQLVAVAWNLGWPIAAGVVLGSTVDEFLHSSPLATLSFSLGALAVGVRRLLDLGREATREHADTQPGGGA
jgi:F0F1-type ATP synthase assembly protein I